MNLISVVIPTYNSSKLLKKCIDSVLKQSYSNIEIIVVDDGSNDDTESMIEKNYNNQIVYIKQKNTGVSSARNTGIKHAKGDFIFFVDADDTIDADALKLLIQKNDKKILKRINYNINYQNGKKFLNKISSTSYETVEFIEQVLSGNVLGVVWGYLFESSIAKKIKFDNNTSYLEDTLFLIEYLKNSKVSSIMIINDGNSNYNYFINDNSMTSTSKKILKKCKDFTYSLTEIDKATHKRYSFLVANQKINLLEKEMRLCKNINEYKEICNEIEIEEYSGKKVNLKIFSKIYKRKKLVILKIYYFLRKFLKKLRNLLQFSN